MLLGPLPRTNRLSKMNNSVMSYFSVAIFLCMVEVADWCSAWLCLIKNGKHEGRAGISFIAPGGSTLWGEIPIGTGLSHADSIFTGHGGLFWLGRGYNKNVSWVSESLSPGPGRLTWVRIQRSKLVSHDRGQHPLVSVVTREAGTLHWQDVHEV